MTQQRRLNFVQRATVSHWRSSKTILVPQGLAAKAATPEDSVKRCETNISMCLKGHLLKGQRSGALTHGRVVCSEMSVHVQTCIAMRGDNAEFWGSTHFLSCHEQGHVSVGCSALKTESGSVTKDEEPRQKTPFASLFGMAEANGAVDF